VIRSILFAAALAVLPVVAGAQSVRSLQQQGPAVPSHMMPPPGKCRIWMDGVAPERQPAPTDCQTALRQRPANGRVVFGPSDRENAETGFRSRTPAARPDTVRRVTPPATREPRESKDTSTNRPTRRRPEPTS
jgi:hypothetical protein